MGGSSDVIGSPFAKHSVESHSNWTMFILWTINISIPVVTSAVMFIDVFSIMISGPFFILFSIVNIYRGVHRKNRRSVVIGVLGLLIVLTIILVISIYNLGPAAAQEPISRLGLWLMLPYSVLVTVFLIREYGIQKQKRPNI